MPKFKNTEFAEGLKLPFSNFEKMYQNIFKEDEMIDAYNVAVSIHNQTDNDKPAEKPKKKNKTTKPKNT